MRQPGPDRGFHVRAVSAGIIQQHRDPVEAPSGVTQYGQHHYRQTTSAVLPADRKSTWVVPCSRSTVRMTFSRCRWHSSLGTTCAVSLAPTRSRCWEQIAGRIHPAPRAPHPPAVGPFFQFCHKKAARSAARLAAREPAALRNRQEGKDPPSAPGSSGGAFACGTLQSTSARPPMAFKAKSRGRGRCSLCR